jgi:hypothetical protein
MQNSALNKADARLLHIWHNFNNYEEELSDDDFPAWLLLHEPGLIHHIDKITKDISVCTPFPALSYKKNSVLFLH